MSPSASDHATSALAGRPTLRDERRSTVTRTIERAALALFTQHGFAEVSVDDVAAAAGISQRTFFRYFDSKSAVLLEYRRRLDRRLLEALRERPAGEGPITALRHAYLSTSTVAEADRDLVLLRARAVASAPVLLARSRGERVAGTEAITTELGKRMGAAHDDPRPRIAATAMSAVADAEWDVWVEGDGRGDPADRIAAALDVLQGGLGELDQTTAR
jgi:AcrR family transcriptional regulator